MHSSLRTRLSISMFFLLIFSVATPFAYVSYLQREEMFSEARTRALGSLTTITWLMTTHPSFVDSSSFSTWVTDYAHQAGIRLSYIVDGRVVVDSAIASYRLHKVGSHANRPEVVDALQKGQGVIFRYSTTLEQELFFASRPVSGIKGIPDGVLRVAFPLPVLEFNVRHAESGILWLLVMVGIASATISFFVTRPFLRDVEELTRMTQTIGQGDYARRIRSITERELRTLAYAINGMAHNIETHLIDLEEQKGRLEAIVNGMREGVMVLDSQGVIVTTNRALTSLFPESKTMQGRTPLEATMKPALQHGVDTLRDNPHSSGHSILLECSNDRIFEVSLVPFMDTSGRCMVLVFHDVSEHERIERMRRDFVANVSHELKTPLTSIKGYSEALLDMPQQSEYATLFLETIKRNADHMTKMVGSLLVLAHSEHKGEQKVFVPVDGCDVVDQCATELEPVAAAKGIGICYSCTESLMVMADRDGLVEVFRNLLDNAIKYSPENTIVTVSTYVGSQSATFCVRDEGVGIPQKSKERIFERFYRVDREGNSIKDGSAGLGLAICRRIVKSYGGEIWVESPVHKGTGAGAAFFVMLPRAEQKDS